MKERVIIVGGGGHAKVVIDILEQTAEVEITGYLAVEEQQDGLYGYRWLGTDGRLGRVIESGVRSAFVAIGDNQRRMASIDTLKSHGFRLINAISPHAVISKYAALAEGIAVMPGAMVNAGAQIGDGVIINTRASIDHDCVIGACAHIAPGVSLAGCVRIGEGVFMGIGSCVIPGVTVGPWTTVGAGGVVVADLPGGVLALGVPAVVKRRRDAQEA